MAVLVGTMSDCPSYLGITINDRLQSEELINYDLLVFCPPQFGVTFWLPNWGQRSARTFDVRLRDSRRTHVVYLTRLLLDAAHEQPALTTSTPTSTDVMADRDLSALFAAVAGVTFTLVLLFLTLFVRLRSPCVRRTPSTAAISGTRRARGRPCRVCAYVTVRVGYSVTASFVTVLLTLSVVVRPELDLLSTVESRLSVVSNDTWWVDDVDGAAGDAALRQVRDAVARHSACTHYVNQLYAVAIGRVARVSSSRSQCLVGTDSDALERLDTAVRQYAGVTRSAERHYRLRVSKTVAGLASVQTRHLAELYNNDWAQFAVGLFNSSVDNDDDARRLHSLPAEVAGTLSRREVDFMAFFSVDVVHEKKTWLDQFWHR